MVTYCKSKRIICKDEEFPSCLSYSCLLIILDHTIYLAAKKRLHLYATFIIKAHKIIPPDRSLCKWEKPAPHEHHLSNICLIDLQHNVRYVVSRSYASTFINKNQLFRQKRTYFFNSGKL